MPTGSEQDHRNNPDLHTGSGIAVWEQMFESIASLESRPQDFKNVMVSGYAKQALQSATRIAR
jgi:hypothetical protein